jgi:hypothetical protein
MILSPLPDWQQVFKTGLLIHFLAAIAAHNQEIDLFIKLKP